MNQSSTSQNVNQWMKYAIQLATKAWGDTHPNPMVGAVLVGSDNQVITEGFHAKAGALHAERSALTGIELTEEQKRTSTLYITLEPCCTHGRTPPCTEIILEKGIQNVVVGAIDPNPSHQSRGIDILRESGVRVLTGVMAQECESINPIFHHRMKYGTPLIALKTAATLDGKIATQAGKSKWITGVQARKNVMLWRKYFPSIAVGAGTVLTDNPSLTIREGETVIGCPIRIVFDRSLRTLDGIDSLNLFNDQWREKTWLITSGENPSTSLKPYLDRGISVSALNFSNGQIPITDFYAECSGKGIEGVYLEGGCSVASSFLSQKAIHYLFCYHAPKLFASEQAPGFVSGLEVETPDEAPHIQFPNYEVLGRDVLCHGILEYS